MSFSGLLWGTCVIPINVCTVFLHEVTFPSGLIPLTSDESVDRLCYSRVSVSWTLLLETRGSFEKKASVDKSLGMKEICIVDPLTPMSDQEQISPYKVRSF